MANLKNEMKNEEAKEFCENNGVVLRTMVTFFKRGFFRMRDLLNTLTDYNMSRDDVYFAVDYLEDRGYLDIRDAETKTHVRSCDAEDIDEIEMRLTADGKLLFYKITNDDGVDF